MVEKFIIIWYDVPIKLIWRNQLSAVYYDPAVQSAQTSAAAAKAAKKG